MKLTRRQLAAICLTIFGSSFAHSASANSIQQCVTEICNSSFSGINANAFMALENTEHPSLNEYYSRYQKQINQVRLDRENQTRKAIQSLSKTASVTDSIKKMKDKELMTMFVKRNLWNLGKDRIDEKYVVVAVPLTNDVQQVQTIKTVFARMQLTSPLYVAQLKVSELNVAPRIALEILEDQRVDTFVVNYLKRQIHKLPSKIQAEYLQKLDRNLEIVGELVGRQGEKAFLWLGDFDIEIQIELGQLKLIGNERSIVEKIMIDLVSGVVSRNEKEIAKIDQIYSESTWEKTCRFSFNRALHYGLTQVEKDRAENKLKPEALRRSATSLKRIFGLELAENIEGHVHTMQIYAPMSLAEYIAYVDYSIKIALTDAQKSDLSLLDQYELVQALGNERDGAIESFCGTWVFEPVRDSVYGNKVFLSSYAAKNYEVGLSIAIHEMGHAVSQALHLFKRRGLSIAPFESIRSCLSENYTTADKKPVYQDQQFTPDKLWTEEDWADAFAGYSMRDLKANGLCGLLGINPQYDYLPLALRGVGPHSPVFYRVMNSHAHLGGIQPNQCPELLQTTYNSTQFKDCISTFVGR